MTRPARKQCPVPRLRRWSVRAAPHAVRDRLAARAKRKEADDAARGSAAADNGGGDGRHRGAGAAGGGRVLPGTPA